jgi:hypothetical protein
MSSTICVFFVNWYLPALTKAQVQMPRLTAMLRSSLLASPSSSSTADQLFVERLKLLQHDPKDSSHASNAYATPHLLGAAPHAAPRSARDAYHHFVAAVHAVLGDSIAGSELAAYIQAVFVALQSRHASPALLQTTLGATPTEQQYASLLATARRLSEERASLSLAPAESASGHRPQEEPEWCYSPPEPATPEPLSPHSALVHLCKPIRTAPVATPANSAGPYQPAESRAGPSTSAWEPSSWQLGQSQAGAGAGGYPDSDDEAMGVRHAKASLTWLENLYCTLKGRKPPSQGGDDTELLLILKVLSSWFAE